MDEAAAPQDQQALRAQLDRAREKLDGLVRDLRAIDAELDGLSSERQQYRLLADACTALEQLAGMGAAALFWGERAGATENVAQLRLVRGRVDVFEKRIGEIEERRQAVLEEVQQQQDDTDLIEDYLREAEDEAERRKQDWVVEREISVLPLRAVMMPWSRGGEDDQRFRKAVATAMALSLIFMLIVPQIEIPLPEFGEEPVEVPERLTRLIMPRPVPPPPPEVPTVEPPEVKQVAEETVPEPAKPKAGPGKGPGQGEGVGPGKGILAFKDQLSGLKVNQQLARLGAEAKVSTQGAASGVVQRSMVTTQGPGSSGGINLAELSRGVNSGGSGGGAGAIAGVQIARATSTIAGGGGGGGADKGVGGHGVLAGRTDEEIQIVFDRHKAALYRLYNRELRRDPTLRGQMILRLRIEPDGSVSMCELKGSDMNAPQLAAQVVDRVRTFDFGAKEGISTVTILYPIDFLPAG